MNAVRATRPTTSTPPIVGGRRTPRVTCSIRCGDGVTALRELYAGARIAPRPEHLYHESESAETG
jgi:hypothetical protein